MGKRAFLAALLVSLASGAAADTLNVVSWDGAYVKSQILGFIRPYEEATGTRVNVIQYAGGIDEVRSQSRAWNVSWDVVDLELFDAIRACNEGLLETIDRATLPAAPDGTPAADDFINRQVTPCGVANVAGSTIVSFRRDAFAKPPSSLEDFFDLSQYPGKRALRKSPQGNLEWALIADGVAHDNVYEVLDTEAGLTRAFAKLDELKSQLVWWQTGQQAVRLLETEQVAMSAVYSGRVAAAVERGEPLEIIWDHQVWYYDVWGIVKNGRNTKLAEDFVRFASSAESLAGQAKYIPYGPMRRSSMAMLDESLRERLPTSEAHLKTAVELNATWWSENLDRIAPRFERWLERPVMVPKSMPR
ncbi:ABC transporter substrate-binding protein [Gilvimarinus agarilyticus]|uniref:ABC transporter substrate-binding protein n=1 Tax=Gilvimarinus agarilyticus TaxID=679259 RepID=UPI0005A2FA43|nr:ABC transporter substrate-binding protein [Gilvimarinus agarilyticus]